MSKEIKERWKLNNYIWQEVVNVIPDIDTIAALATVNKYFYKIVGIDFKTRCIQNGIYRLPRELWSEAFSHVCRRFDNHYYNLFASPRLSQNTSRISAILNNEVIVTTIDFNRHFIQTFKIRGYAYHLKLYNKGTRFILRPAFDGFLRVYDVESRKLLWEHPIDYLEKKRRICIMSDFCIYDKRTKEVYDPYALKAHKIDIKDVVGFKCAYNDYHDYYFSFHVKPFDAEREVVVMNVRTKKLSCFPVQHVFCDEISRGNCDDKVMPATECVLIFDNVTNDVKIYDIPSETLKHNFHFETTYTNTLFLNETMFVSTLCNKLICYQKSSKSWLLYPFKCDDLKTHIFEYSKLKFYKEDTCHGMATKYTYVYLENRNGKIFRKSMLCTDTKVHQLRNMLNKLLYKVKCNECFSMFKYNETGRTVFLPSPTKRPRVECGERPDGTQFCVEHEHLYRSGNELLWELPTEVEMNAYLGKALREWVRNEISTKYNNEVSFLEIFSGSNFDFAGHNI